MAAETTNQSQGKPRPTRTGVVTSTQRQKTITVEYQYRAKHRIYKKYLRHTTRLHAHDEHGDARVGDRVMVEFCRPYSKTKCWRLSRILERASGESSSESSEF